jgi:hypothetical protein
MADENTIYKITTTDLDTETQNPPFYVRGVERMRQTVKMYSGEGLLAKAEELTELPEGVTEADLEK